MTVNRSRLWPDREDTVSSRRQTTTDAESAGSLFGMPSDERYIYGQFSPREGVSPYQSRSSSDMVRPSFELTSLASETYAGPSESIARYATLDTIAHSLCAMRDKLREQADAIRDIQEHLEEKPTTYSVQLFELGSAHYSLTTPLVVTIQQYPDEVTARLPQFNLYASAESDTLALVGLKAEFVGTYERLEELGPDRLGPLPLQWLAGMRAVVERVNE